MAPSLLEQYLAPFLSAGSIITSTICTVSITFFIYGIYCVVFGLSVQVLFQHSSAHRLYMGCSIALFVLATSFTAVNTWGTIQQALVGFQAATTKNYFPFVQYLAGGNGETAYVVSKGIISSLMNSIADIMLIHRCYVLFSYNNLILLLLSVIAFTLNGLDLGCIIATTYGLGTSSKPLNIPLVLKANTIDRDTMMGIVVFQVILALMTGGRIWWIISQSRQIIGGPTHSRYRNIVAIIIESAVLYAGTLLAAIVLGATMDPFLSGVSSFDLPTASTLLSGLAPNLIVLRVAHGKSVNSVQETISTFRAVSARNSQATSTRRTIVLPL